MSVFSTSSETIIPPQEPTLDWQSYKPGQGYQPTDPTHRYLWIKVPLPSDRPQNSFVALRRCMIVFQVYLNEKQIAQWGRYNPQAIDGIEASHYLPIVSVPPELNQNTLYLKAYRFGRQNDSGRCATVALGEHTSLILERFSLLTHQMAIGFIFIGIGLGMLLYTFFIRQIMTLTFSLFTLIMGVSFCGGVPIISFLGSSNWEYWAFWQLSLFVFPIFFIWFLGTHNEKHFRWYLWGTSPNMVLTIFHISMWNGYAGYRLYALRDINMVVLIVQALVLICVGIYQIRTAKGYTRIIAYTFLGIFLVTMYDSLLLLTATSRTTLSPYACFLMVNVQLTVILLRQRDRVRELERAKREQIELARDKLEQEVHLRTKDLHAQKEALAQANQELAEGNNLLKTSNSQLETLNSKNQILLKQISYIDDHSLTKLIDIVGRIPDSSGLTIAAVDELSRLKDSLAPLASLYQSEQEISKKKIIHLAQSKGEQRLLRFSLGGTLIKLVQTDSVETSKDLLKQGDFELLIMGPEFLDMAAYCQKECPNTKTILMTSEDFSKHIDILIKRDEISNLVFKDTNDPTFSMRTMATTVAKIINDDYFGISKYLAWGTRIQEVKITSSDTRHQIIGMMGRVLKDMGMRKSVINRSFLICDEMLMNAIYDAPMDQDGNPKYNHLPRTEAVELEEHEQGMFCYASDGATLAIAVQDPFGALTRETMLRYVKSCYDGEYGAINERLGKAGGGMGLFQILSASDLVIVNVKPGVRTEFISLINIGAKSKSNRQAVAFQFFNV
ncbi:hypothetical protein [Pseudobacteriovorax antillogorgiicola]|nr:hypothetical protein [Pseudobacteriovorax antillogorgiicola]